MDSTFGPVVLWALGLGLLFAALDWIAVWRRMQGLEYVAKPAALVAFIIAGVLLAQQVGWGDLARWFVPALVLSLAGDVFLMLPGERWFLPGLVAFLLAHVAYIIGFNQALPPLAALALIPVIAVLDWIVLSRVVAGVVRSGAPEMRAPVIVYGIVLSLTLFSGWATWFRPAWGWGARVAAALGASLFFASDLLLAWDKFVQKSRAMQLAVIVTYHVAQLLLTLVIGLAG